MQTLTLDDASSPPPLPVSMPKVRPPLPPSKPHQAEKRTSRGPPPTADRPPASAEPAAAAASVVENQTPGI